jgi:hypothetical protein
VVSGGFPKLGLWEVQGSNPVDSQNNFTYKHNVQRMSDTWHPRVGPCVLILFTQNGHVSTPYSPTNNQPTIATSSNCHIIMMVRPSTWPYGLYGQVQSASQIFAFLAWRTDRDIVSVGSHSWIACRSRAQHPSVLCHDSFNG